MYAVTCSNSSPVCTSRSLSLWPTTWPRSFLTGSVARMRYSTVVQPQSRTTPKRKDFNGAAAEAASSVDSGALDQLVDRRALGEGRPVGGLRVHDERQPPVS